MGWFFKKTCDWCGLKFRGGGTAVGELVFCTETCKSQQSAPARKEGEWAPPYSKLDELRDNIEKGSRDIERYAKALTRARDSRSEEELADWTSKADLTLANLLGRMNSMRETLLEHNRDTSRYEAIVRELQNAEDNVQIDKRSVRLGLAAGGIAVKKSISFSVDGSELRLASHALDALIAEAEPVIAANPS